MYKVLKIWYIKSWVFLFRLNTECHQGSVHQVIYKRIQVFSFRICLKRNPILLWAILLVNCVVKSGCCGNILFTGMFLKNFIADRLNKVRLTEPNSAVNKEWVICFPIIRYRICSGNLQVHYCHLLQNYQKHASGFKLQLNSSSWLSSFIVAEPNNLYLKKNFPEEFLIDQRF